MLMDITILCFIRVTLCFVPQIEMNVDISLVILNTHVFLKIQI